MPNVLQEAEKIIYGDREQTYGDPSRNLKVIAGFWSTYLGSEISEYDVCHMMMLLKIARLKNSHDHVDSLIDVAGYAGLSGRCMDGGKS